MLNGHKYRRSIRLQGYDYSSAGIYFITICAHDRKPSFGEIKANKVELTEIGLIAQACWLEIPRHFPGVEVDEYVIMPNHVHGLLVLKKGEYERVTHSQKRTPGRSQFQHITPDSIGSMIRSYKSAVTRLCRKNDADQFSWQRNYYEHVVRSEKELHRIRQYIANNPLKWVLDRENPDSPDFNIDDRQYFKGIYDT